VGRRQNPSICADVNEDAVGVLPRRGALSVSPPALCCVRTLKNIANRGIVRLHIRDASGVWEVTGTAGKNRVSSYCVTIAVHGLFADFRGPIS